MLLTRDIFRESVFIRDQYQCVICKEEAQDAHHIIERRLFDNGGYFYENGASLCSQCHIEAEKTNISVEQIREAAGIIRKVVPEDFYAGTTYDKWGNIILPNGTRLRGPLFYDESVQKILKDKLHLFTSLVKYPRTYHWGPSPGCTKDDVRHKTGPFKEDERVVVTVKMDGENTTLYSDHIHARSLDSNNHPSRNWVKNFWSNIKHNIPEGYRLSGENLYAKHSIHYKDLSTYFYGFSMWNDKNECLSWDETLEWFELLDVEPVPTIYRGHYDPELILDQIQMYIDEGEEGAVIRTVNSFPFGNFKNSLVKYVRANHVQTEHNWMMKEIIKNELKL